MKTQLPFVIIAAGLFLLPSDLVAQIQQGTTVQLPAFRTQRVDTSVWVPDRGSASLGGIHRSSMGRTSRSVPFLGSIPGLRRLFRNDAIGRESSSDHTRAHVQIIDLDELDQAVLAEAAQRRAWHGGSAVVADEAIFGGKAPEKTAQELAARKKADFISRNIGRSSSNR